VPASRTAARKRRSRPRPTSRRVLPADPPRTAHPLNRLLLDGRRLDMQIGDRLTGARLERTIEGASTLTLEVWDGDRAVLRSGIFGRAALETSLTVRLDGLDYYVAGVSKSGDSLTITCEDAVILKLKRHGKTKPLRVSRGTITRAGFCASMFRQAGVPVVVLDEAVIQPVAGAKALRTELRKAKSGTEKKGRTAAQGVPAGNITLNGKAPTQAQRRNIAAVLGAAAKRKAGPKATLALLEACHVEAGGYKGSGPFDNPAGGDATSVGILQLLDIHKVDRMNVATVCDLFLMKGFYGKGGAIELARKNPSWSAGQIAQACQGSAYPDRYDKTREECLKILAAGGGDVSGEDGGTAYIKQFAFERQKGESSWTAARRLLDEVQWRLFVREGVVVIASDPALMRARPSLTIAERSDSVETLDYDWHRALRIGEMTGQAYVGRYQADPGEVVDVDGFPPEDRRWLLATVSTDLLIDTPTADIALRQPQNPAKEPASEVVTTDGDSGSGDTAADGTAAALFAACKAISDKKLPYVWGGGHAKIGTPDNGTGRDKGTGYDCSGSTAAALAAAGLGYTVGGPGVVSGDMARSYGKPGQGKSVTVWANAGHVFIRFTGGDMNGYEFNTAGHPGDRGPRLLKQNYGTNGFTPRHPEGL
jgi:hypothetical protein